MRKTIRLMALLCSAAALLTLAACGGKPASVPSPTPSAVPSPSPTAQSTPEPTPEPLTEFSDIRYLGIEGLDTQVYPAGDYSLEFLRTLHFNESVVVTGSEELMAQILEWGKDPGLGIRALHERGITGQGVNVAIIDQNMQLDHPEFAGKIAAYYDTGCNMGEDTGSMHGPAVTSILAGETVGVAPGVKVYYAAAPSWLEDSQYYADAADWIIEQNRLLPEGEKIRVVSVSAALYGGDSPFSNGEAWKDAVKALQAEGILVLDCGSDPEVCRIGPCRYDPEDREDPAKCSGGYQSHAFRLPDFMVGAPASYRTIAEEYFEGECSYQYDADGGHSWAAPYGAGVLALGWQLDPSLSNEEIMQLLFDTCATGTDGSNIIDPTAFVEAIESRLG